jgi:hypothetical protein
MKPHETGKCSHAQRAQPSLRYASRLLSRLSWTYLVARPGQVIMAVGCGAVQQGNRSWHVGEG